MVLRHITVEESQRLEALYLSSYRALQTAFYQTQEVSGKEAYHTSIKRIRETVETYYRTAFRQYDFQLGFLDDLTTKKENATLLNLNEKEAPLFILNIAVIYKKREVGKKLLDVAELGEDVVACLHALAATKYMMLEYKSDDVRMRMRGPFQLLFEASERDLEALITQV